MDSFAQRFQRFAPVSLRWGLAIVFFLFGLQKLTNSSQATAEIQLLLNFELVDAAAINFYLGISELLIGIAFVIGWKVRIFSLAASVFVATFFLSFLFVYGLSINPNLYRDMGLLGASIALFLLGAGPLSFDEDKKKEEGQKS